MTLLENKHRVAPPTVVTGLPITFRCNKNKLVPYETHHRDKTICGDVQRLLSTEFRFGDGEVLCPIRQEFFDYWRKVFSKLQTIFTNLPAALFTL